MQITKAMELVATSKLRRAKERLEKSRPYHKLIGEAIAKIESSTETGSSIWSKETAGNRTLYVVIAGDRGLAGGYNSNVFRLVESLARGNESLILPIGKKAHEYYRHRGTPSYCEDYVYVDDVTVSDSIAISERICDGYIAGEFDSVVLVYTRFDSMLSQTTKHERLLPITCESTADVQSFDPIYYGEYDELLAKLVPSYIGGVVYSAVCESLASELGARRCAMESANKNAGEIIDTLKLQFNRARQAVITQEITEIVSGSEAL